jgi:hypothetical protein
MNAMEFNQHKVDRSLRASEIGLVAILLLVAASTLGWPLPVSALAYVVILVTVMMLFANRKQDEFLERHWNTAATTAFFAICLWGLLAPFTIGVIDGVTGAEHGRNVADTLAKSILPIALVSFFGAFQFSRLRNG